MKILVFLQLKKSLYIAWASFRNDKTSFFDKVHNRLGQVISLHKAADRRNAILIYMTSNAINCIKDNKIAAKMQQNHFK